MTLGKFKEHIESFPDNSTFIFGISEPFSWRGVYSEIAFELLEEPMAKEEILRRIEIGLTKTFTGYKGGQYTYDEYTEIHFESDISSWSDEDYTATKIAQIENKDKFISQEERLVKLAFS